MITILIFALLAAAAYGVAAVCAWRDRHDLARWLSLTGIALHSLALGLQLTHDGRLHIGFTEALSLFSWQSAVLLWVFSLKERVQINGVVIYPVAGLLVVVAGLAPSPPVSIHLHQWKVSLHLLLSMLSAGLLTIAAVHAVALAIQERLLHKHRIARLSGRLPPLQTMERLLFQMVAIGFLLLSLTLLTGLWFVQDWLTQHLAHKTVLSVIAWLIFGILLWGRWRHGWRGRVAVRWALAGYFVLFLSYFGSKFILEQMLGEHWLLSGS